MVNLFDSFFYKLWPAVHRFIATFFVLVIENCLFLTQLLQLIIPITQLKIIGNVFGNRIFVLIAITYLCFYTGVEFVLYKDFFQPIPGQKHIKKFSESFFVITIYCRLFG